MKQRFITIVAVLLTAFVVSLGICYADAITNPWDNGNYKGGTKVTAQLGRFDDLFLFGTGTIYGPLVLEGVTFDDYQTTISTTDPTADQTITLPDQTGAVPVVVKQGYTQFEHGEATTVDVTGASLTLPEYWFIEGKAFRVKAGGTVTGANGAVTVALYLEDAAVSTLTTAAGAAGDWTAEFIVVATGAATQRIIGNLVAGSGADVVADYAADTTDTTSAGTVPLKLQVGLANAADSITCEYWLIEHWDLAE